MIRLADSVVLGNALSGEITNVGDARRKWCEISAVARTLEEGGKARLIEAMLADFETGMRAESQADRLLTRDEALAWSRYSAAQFRKLEVAGQITPIWAKGERRYRQDDLPRRPARTEASAAQPRAGRRTLVEVDPAEVRRNMIRQSARETAQRYN